MSAVETLPRDRPMAVIARELDVDLERMRYWLRAGLIRVYRFERVWYVRRGDEPWIRTLATLVQLGASVEALTNAAFAGELALLLKRLGASASRAQVPEWLELHG